MEEPHFLGVRSGVAAMEKGCLVPQQRNSTTVCLQDTRGNRSRFVVTSTD